MGLVESYADRSVFVTGHTGFKGAWLAEWLGSLGAEVTGYALDPPTQPSLFDALDLGARLKHVVADVRDRGRLVAEVQAARPSLIFHLAAQPLVRRAYAEPHETFETNVMGTVNVLEAARACPSVRAVVIVTSDKCYQNLETGRAFRETDAMGGRDPYSASKGCAELVTAAYRESFFADGTAVASVRAGNVIGAGDWAADRIIPDCVIRMPSDPGNMSSSPWRGTFGLRPSCCAMAAVTKGRGTSVPPTRTAPGRCAGWSSAFWRSGVRARGPRRPMSGGSPMKPTG
jgi:CDP-glucose 4,6-dehydratase